MTVKKQNAIYFLVIFLFIIGLNEIFATTCLTMSGTNYTLTHHTQGQSPTEYVVSINAQNITIDRNLVFTKINVTNPECLEKTFVLRVDKNITFVLKDQNQYISISGDLNIIRFDSSQQGGAYINFFVNNNEQQLHPFASMGILDIKVPLIEVKSHAGIRAYEKKRIWMDNDSLENSTKRNGFGVKVILKDILVRNNFDFNVSVIATTPTSHFEKNGDTAACESSTTQHGMHGGQSSLLVNSIENYGNFNLSVIGADGSMGSKGCLRKHQEGGDGGKGGFANLDVNNIENLSNFYISLISGNGANGAQGSDEQASNCRGWPKKGGAAGNGGDLNYSIKNIDNNVIDSKFNVVLNSGNGGDGGRAGLDKCGPSDKKTGGDGGRAGNISLLNYSEILNYGDYNFILNAGNGGEGGQGSKRKSTYRGDTGKSGSGGSISDYNLSNIINSGNFAIYLKSGKININDKKNKNNQNRGIATAGYVGSVNIDYLSNTVPGLEIVLNLNEEDSRNLNSSGCECVENVECNINSPDPTIGNININYINSGSYLPKKLDIIKRVPISSSPTITINSCYLLSSGNSQLFYQAEVFNFKSSNLADIAKDFNSSSKIGFYNLEQIFCPVCDSLELDNPLRIDKEYTIYSSVDSNIVDLNIYYLTPDGNIFRPPGYLIDQNYIVYSLKSGQKIEATNGLLFNGVKEYHIDKDKLLFNPRMLDLDTIDNIKLFCPGQKYRLVYKLQNNQTKTIDFTPIFNIR